MKDADDSRRLCRFKKVGTICVEPSETHLANSEFWTE